MSQSLFYWITYSYDSTATTIAPGFVTSQSLFYWITYSYVMKNILTLKELNSLNPYFIGLPILMGRFYLPLRLYGRSLNPYFIGLPILIIPHLRGAIEASIVSILILLDYLFLYYGIKKSKETGLESQSLFYWITYSYQRRS